MKRIWFGSSTAVVAALLFSSCNHSLRRPEAPPLAIQQTREERARSEGTGKKWIVSTQGQAASRAVKEVFDAGGNMIDAAIAASFVISVERPQSTGIGGGGFLLYREAKTGKVYAVDFRERAPNRAHSKLFVDSKNEVIEDKSTVGTHASGVPGLVKGMVEIHRKFGNLPFARLVDPAIRLAEEGFEVYPYLATALDEDRKYLEKFPETTAIFFREGRPLKLGERVVQKDLAQSLRRIARTGGKDFYEGETARAIARTTKNWISLADLKGYRVKWREPVRGTFLGYEVISMPPPSSGGTHVIEILNILENRPGLFTLAPRSAESVHWIASAMQSAFVDRARYMGDPEFVKIPLAKLISKAYARTLYESISPGRAASADQRAAMMTMIPPSMNSESPDTTHFSILDAEGNMVASTQSVNGWFGSYQVARGTGILLNNTMDDFAAKPGAQNIFGAVGSVANLVQSRKTPLSSMSPTFVLKDGVPVMNLGAPGGTRIITCVTQTILNYLGYRQSLYDSVAMVRVHQQWRPDELLIEKPGVGLETTERLKAMGHAVREGKVGCAVMATAREGDVLRGVSDPRDVGSALGE